MTALRTTGTHLDRILAKTVVTVRESIARVHREEMARRAIEAPAPVDVRPKLCTDTVALIAEIKRASPSKGRFPVDVEPASVAREYVEGGAAAISCLTDEPFFQGSLDDLRQVAAVASAASPPVAVLRKDFTTDPYQIDEARANGASLVLLIAAVLDDGQLRTFREHAEQLGMAALVEVHDEEEARRAVVSGATVIGINNRDLRSFHVDLAVTERIAPLLSSDATIVAESGIFTTQHVERMAGAGADAVLVGESLILREDRVAAVRELTGVQREH
jgi:indole-3-glycerol phosphate synthase